MHVRLISPFGGSRLEVVFWIEIPNEVKPMRNPFAPLNSNNGCDKYIYIYIYTSFNLTGVKGVKTPCDDRLLYTIDLNLPLEP